MEISELQTLLNILIECNVSYYQDSNVTLCLSGARRVTEAAGEEEPVQKTEEQVRIEERLQKLPENYRQLFR